MGPGVIIPILAIFGLGIAGAAASAKKKQQAAAPAAAPPAATPEGQAAQQAAAAGQAAGVSAATALGATQAASQAVQIAAVNAASQAAAAAGQPVPADVLALVTAAVQSQNPDTMRRAADQLQTKYPQIAADLRRTAATFDIAIAAQQAASGTPPPSIIPGTAGNAPPMPGPTAVPVGVPTTINVPTVTVAAPKPPIAGMPAATQQPVPAATDPNRMRAQSLVLALKVAKKGTATEPKAQVKEFQLVERLPRTDGSYGSETATALADRYGIVPPKPLYWGKAGGDYSTLTADKNQYAAHLLNLATNDPQRADEWRSAAKV